MTRDPNTIARGALMDMLGSAAAATAKAQGLPADFPITPIVSPSVFAAFAAPGAAGELPGLALEMDTYSLVTRARATSQYGSPQIELMAQRGVLVPRIWDGIARQSRALANVLYARLLFMHDTPTVRRDTLIPLNVSKWTSPQSLLTSGVRRSVSSARRLRLSMMSRANLMDAVSNTLAGAGSALSRVHVDVSSPAFAQKLQALSASLEGPASDDGDDDDVDAAAAAGLPLGEESKGGVVSAGGAPKINRAVSFGGAGGGLNVLRDAIQRRAAALADREATSAYDKLLRQAANTKIPRIGEIAAVAAYRKLAQPTFSTFTRVNSSVRVSHPMLLAKTRAQPDFLIARGCFGLEAVPGTFVLGPKSLGDWNESGVSYVELDIRGRGPFVVGVGTGATSLTTNLEQQASCVTFSSSGTIRRWAIREGEQVKGLEAPCVVGLLYRHSSKKLQIVTNGNPRNSIRLASAHEPRNLHPVVQLGAADMTVSISYTGPWKYTLPANLIRHTDVAGRFFDREVRADMLGAHLTPKQLQERMEADRKLINAARERADGKGDPLLSDPVLVGEGAPGALAPAAAAAGEHAAAVAAVAKAGNIADRREALKRLFGETKGELPKGKDGLVTLQFGNVQVGPNVRVQGQSNVMLNGQPCNAGQGAEGGPAGLPDDAPAAAAAAAGPPSRGRRRRCRRRCRRCR